MKSIGEAISGGFVPTNEDTSINDIQVPCRECGKQTPYNSHLLKAFGGNERIVVCDACCDGDKERSSQEYRESIVTVRPPVEDLIKPLYMETNFNKLPSQAQMHWQDMKHWSPSVGSGLRLCGAQRAGKSRLLTLLLRKLYNDGEDFRIFYAGEFHAGLSQAKRSQFYKNWKDEVVNVPILAIDDLFAEKLTESVEAGLFEIINQRMERKLPLLYTSQVTTGDAIVRFSDERRGRAFINRLKQTTKLYYFESITQEEMMYVED